MSTLTKVVKNSPLPKGHAKYGGRQKGTKNKKTLILDSFAQSICEGGAAKFQRELSKLKGVSFINAYMTLFEYVKPKLSRSDMNVSGNVHLSDEPIVFE